MSTDNPGYVYAYGWNRLNMRFIGAWPEPNENFLVMNRAWVYAGLIFALVWVPQTASLFFLQDDLNELIDCLVINVPVGLSVIKLVLYRLRRNGTELLLDEISLQAIAYHFDIIARILSMMAEDWSMTRTDSELEAMLEKAKYTRIISAISAGLAGSMVIAFSSFRASAAKFERQSITNETRLAIGFLYPAYFPYDTKGMRGFLPTWFGQWVATVFSLFGYSGPDSFLAMFVLHLCGQLATVRIALANIVDDECIKDPSLYWKRLGSIIERHEQLNRYGELLEGSFNFMLLIQIVLCTITFCFQGFVTISTLIGGLASNESFPMLQMVFVTLHAIYTILHLFACCWAGDILVVESTALSHAPYESDWFRLPPAQARALMMVTNRSRIPLQITAGKFVSFSLELFTSIMKTSMGYLSVLMAVKDN